MMTPFRRVGEFTRIQRGQCHRPLVWLIVSAIIVLLAACSQEAIRDQKRTPLPTTPHATAAATESATEQALEPTATTVVQAAVSATLDVAPDADLLKFDVETLTVVAGAQVLLTLNNVSTINQHNWVLVNAGTKDDVATRGIIHSTTNWIQPDDPNVIANTKLLIAGETGEVRFTAPPAGAYQFVCTFPGHSATMFGDFQVTP